MRHVQRCCDPLQDPDNRFVSPIAPRPHRSLVIGENETFRGAEDHLRSKGVQLIHMNDKRCVALVQKFIKEKPHLWNEDIAAKE